MASFANLQAPSSRPVTARATNRATAKAFQTERAKRLVDALKSRHAKIQPRVPPPVRSRRVDSPILPPAIQLGKNGEDMMDLYSYLLRNRIVFLGGFVDFEMATKIVGSILALDALDEEEDIKLYINSPVLGVVDVIRATKAKISTVAFGISGGNASLILAAGAKGKRFAMPSSRILLQQPAGYIAGSSVEANITATELDRSLQVITHLYAEFANQTVEQMEMETNRENFLSPEEAAELGVIDAVV